MLKDKAPRLYQYVVGAILDAADKDSPTGTRTPDTTHIAFRDAHNGLTDGWWNEIVYTSGALSMYNEFSEDIAYVLVAYAAEIPLPPSALQVPFYHGPTLGQVFESLTPSLATTSEDAGQHWDCYAGLALAMECIICDAAYERGISL